MFPMSRWHQLGLMTIGINDIMYKVDNRGNLRYT